MAARQGRAPAGLNPAAPYPDLLRLKRYFTEFEQLTYEARRNSLTAIDYYDSDQFTREELAKLRERGQPAIVINRIKPAINGILGVTERGRSDPRAWPRNPADTDAADTATDVLRYVADFNRFRRLKLDAFKDMLIAGTGAALIGADADLQVTITQIRWEEFFADPRSRRPDHKDARYLGIAKWMYADDLVALYPDKAREVALSVENTPIGGGMVPDQSFQDRPLNGPGTGGAWIDPKLRRLLVLEMYWRDGSDWNRSVFTGSDILEHGPSPYLDHKGRPTCPIEAQSAYVRRDNGRYGAVWDMIPVQDEINKRRSKSLHLLSVTRIEVKDPSAINIDAEEARREAARPDGVIPYGWGLSPNTAELQGNLELMAEAKAELERMGPSPAVLGRSAEDASGRALLARQQSGLTELSLLYGGLEDWELRVYRQCWARAKQFWRAPQFIRVTDDENAPRFVGLNQPVQDEATGAVLGYRNALAEMDVDIEVDTQQDVGNLQAEAFSELIDLVKLSPAYQQQVSLKELIQLSPIVHKQAVLDVIDQAAQAQQAQAAQEHALAQAHGQAQIGKLQSEAQRNQAEGTAKMLNALSEAHAVHAEHNAAGFEAGVAQAQADKAQAMTQQQMAAEQAAAQAAQNQGLNGGGPA
ncbi:MAG: hypothetical protein KGL69_02735 [Alphaproteobacteria bacterium]|nr:hypothetical protein [Alphaproteobacteria bacterium]